MRRTTTIGPRDRKIPSSSSRQPPPPCLPTLEAIELLLTRALNKYQLAIIEEFNQPLLFRNSRPRALNNYKRNIPGSNSSSSWNLRKRGECANVLVAGTYITMLMRIVVSNAITSIGYNAVNVTGSISVNWETDVWIALTTQGQLKRRQYLSGVPFVSTKLTAISRKNAPFKCAHLFWIRVLN